MEDTLERPNTRDRFNRAKESSYECNMTPFYPVYSNHAQLLLMTVSKHLHILKDGTMTRRDKEMKFNLKNCHKAATDLFVHYFIRELYSGVCYAEVHSSRKLVPLKEFLYRAWAPKDDYEFCGMPNLVFAPKAVREEEKIGAVHLPGLLNYFGIHLELPPEGYDKGEKQLARWERFLTLLPSSIDGLNPEAVLFETIQAKALDFCRRDSQWYDIGIGKKIENWKNNLVAIRQPPTKDFFLNAGLESSDEYIERTGELELAL